MRFLFLLLLSFILFASGNALEKCRRGGCLEGAEEYVEKEADLFLLISFSMPEEALLHFSKELELYGGGFVLRGIPENSFKELFKKISSLRDRGMNAPISIDPDLFEEFGGGVVPTLLLRGEEGIDRITGNISIRDSLERIAHTGTNKQLAKEKLQ